MLIKTTKNPGKEIIPTNVGRLRSYLLACSAANTTLGGQWGASARTFVGATSFFVVGVGDTFSSKGTRGRLS